MHLAAQGAQFSAARGEEIAPLDQQFAGVRFDEPQQHARKRRLSAARFADDRERFARGQLEAYVIDRLDNHAVLRGIRFTQISGLE